MRQGRPEACCKQQGRVARAADTCSYLGSNPSAATTFAGLLNNLVGPVPKAAAPATHNHPGSWTGAPWPGAELLRLPSRYQ